MKLYKNSCAGTENYFCDNYKQFFYIYYLYEARNL